MGLEPAACGYVGDSGIDMEFAQACGMLAIGVTWGFRSREELQQSGADHLLDEVAGLLRL
jgi:phosphoglycolate phosphatase